jgi:hypothetical protein
MVSTVVGPLPGVRARTVHGGRDGPGADARFEAHRTAARV